MANKIKPEGDFLLEISWEVCNRVGGIYRVLESKAAQISSFYRKNYCLIGPYFPEKFKGEFRETSSPPALKQVFASLEKEGIKCFYGHWLIKGEPGVILVDFSGFWSRADEIKKQLWEAYNIDSLSAGNDFTEPVVWAWAVGRVIEELLLIFKKKKPILHFQEWLSGAALLYLKKKKIKAATVFTTHSTVLGRTLANNNIPLYPFLKTLEPDKEVYKYNLQAKHQLEKQSACQANVFSTVSEITGIEAQYVLGRMPCIFLPNGLDIGKFPGFEDIIIKHKLQESRLREFVLQYFFPYYSFSLRHTIFYFIVGRYEFYNKGINLFIKALGCLNQRLKEKGSKKTIVVFFWIPSNVHGVRNEILDCQKAYLDIKDSLTEILGEVQENLIYSLLVGKESQKLFLFEGQEDFLKVIEKKLLRFKKKGLPPVSTHYLSDPNDIILRFFQEERLENKEEDRVKVIFCPIYLTGSDGLLNLDYRESIIGSDLGVFPSFYEPWGYTALETAALGVASLTTDLSGFGRFIKDYCQNKKNPGIFILERFNQGEEKVIQELFKTLEHFLELSPRRKEENKIQARKLAELADWEILIENYIKAHNEALKKLK